MKLTNNTILITGGSRGIGLEMAKRFAQLKNEVIIISRDKKRLAAVKKANLNLICYQFDLEKSNDVEDLIVLIENEYPKLNVIINNAAVQYNYSFLDERSLQSKIDSEIDLNFKTPIKLIGSLLPTLINKDEAAIVNISSALAFAPKESAPVYCATKSALHNFSIALRYQLENTNVKVFDLIPPLVNTDMTKGRGKNKIEPSELVGTFLKGFRKNEFEITIGKVKLFRIIQRFTPSIALQILRKS